MLMKKSKLLLFLVMTVSAFGYSQNKYTEQLLWKLKRINEVSVASNGEAFIYTLSSPSVADNKSSKEVFISKISTGEPKLLIDKSYKAFAIKFRPDGKKVGFISAKNGSAQVWEINTDGSYPVQVTKDPDGINGFLYAPDMKYLLFFKDVKLDNSVKDIYPDLDKCEGRIIDGLDYRHWDAWRNYTYSHVFYVAYNDGKTTGTAKDIMPDEHFDAPNPPNDGEEQFAWSADSKQIAYSCKKQAGTAYANSTNTDIYVYDISSGKTINITDGNLGYDSSPQYSPDGKSIAWLSMETPAYESDKNRLMVMDLETKSKTELTASLDRTVNTFTWSGGSKKIYFIPTTEGTKQIYQYDFTAKKIKSITSGAHDYTGVFPYTVANSEQLVGTKTTLAAPADIFGIDIPTGAEKQLTFVNRDLLSGVTTGKVEKRLIKATDGKDILTWVIYPPDFDPAKKYPTLLFCQGGPQSPVSQFFSYRWNFQLMASNGYIVVAPNRRGLQGFGQEWNDQITGDYGGQCMADLLSAIDDVAKEPYVNKDKLGAVGASFGGYSVYWLAGNHNKRFKAFISHDGMFNMESWYGTTEELFFANHDQKGAYWENPDNYNKFSPHRYVKNWDTPILIIHSEKDFRVNVGEGIQAFTAAQQRGVPSRFLYFPDENHWVTKPQNGILWQRTFFSWLDKYLK
jgi:dipeptidyl aminopeptidase/acylaminoacyl peptidase